MSLAGRRLLNTRISGNREVDLVLNTGRKQMMPVHAMDKEN